MNGINDGGPAFPADVERRDPITGEWGPLPPQGMTLRDYFAGQALAGFLAGNWGAQDDAAQWSYSQADAMIKARAAAPQQAGEESGK